MARECWRRDIPVHGLSCSSQGGGGGEGGKLRSGEYRLTASSDSIFYDDQTHILFATFKYVGYDYAGDMERMSENPKVREWWKLTDALQESMVPGAKSSEAGVPAWWKPVEEVFYQA